MPVDRVPENDKAGIVTVPVKVGDAISALVADAVAIALNSVSNSVPRIILLVSPLEQTILSSKVCCL